MSMNLPVQEKVDPRVRRTRALIVQAFFEILDAKGFQSISVQDITGKAGINRSTFYLHFPDKFALVDYSIGEMFRQEIEKRVLNACHFSEGNLRALILTVSDFVATANAHCASADPQFESLVEAQVKRQTQDLLQVWIEAADPGPDCRTTAIAASWAIYGLALEWSRDRKHTPAEAFADQVLPRIAAILGLQQPA